MLFVFVVAGFAAMFLAHTAPFPFLLDGLASNRAIWRMPAGDGGPRIYLTFDDGPNPEATPAVLDELARHKAKATFFVIDRHVNESTAPILQRMFLDGHTVGLHSHTRQLMFLSPERLAETLEAAAARIEAFTGRRPCRAFRPHAGWRSSQMYEGLKRIDYRLVGWGWGLWDWNWYRKRTASSIVPRLVRRASPGDIIVMHDGHHVDPGADRDYAVEATALLVPALRAKGFTLASICERGSGP